jgi:hypothetical protein
MKTLYIRLDASGYVSDAIYYQHQGYIEFLGEGKPEDLLNECYQLIDGEFILDQEKYDLLYPEEEDPGIPPIF